MGGSRGSLRCGEPSRPPPDAPVSQDESQANMPAYFRFLTIMAFHVFLQEKVGAVGVCGDGLGSDVGV